MADTDTSRLCTQIIHSHFGPLTAKVAAALLSRGRLSLTQLVRFTSLKPRTVRASIIILVQHNLAWHSQSDTEGEAIEFNSEECLLRLRFGRFVWQADQLFGSAAAEIVSLILDHGKLKSSDIISQLSSSSSKGPAPYNQALLKLVNGSYLIPSNALFHVSPRDKLLQYEAEEKGQIKNFPTAKELREAKTKAEARLRREQDEAMKTGLSKRKVVENGTGRSVKRKIAAEDVIDDAYFRVNSTKFNVHIRNQLIESAARERYNDSIAIVMRSVLKASEAKQLSLSETRSEPVTVNSVAMGIPDDEKLLGLWYPPRERPPILTCVKEALGVLSSADNPTVSGRRNSFVTLGDSSSKVQVEFDIICRRLRRKVLESVVADRYGEEAVRVVRFLLENGKMSSDQVAKVAMMPTNIVMPLLTSLAENSLISIQEVPKGADRNPQRTFYLWHVDLFKTYTALLDNLYKTLFNISVRKQAEEEESTLKLVLEKCQRSDVQQDASLLTRVEREVLQGWTEKRNKLSVLEMRVEEVVFILRDLGLLSNEED